MYVVLIKSWGSSIRIQIILLPWAMAKQMDFSFTDCFVNQREEATEESESKLALKGFLLPSGNSGCWRAKAVGSIQHSNKISILDVYMAPLIFSRLFSLFLLSHTKCMSYSKKNC